MGRQVDCVPWPRRYNVEAGVLPEDKAKLVQTLRATGRSVAMAGDRVKDAPALGAVVRQCHRECASASGGAPVGGQLPRRSQWPSLSKWTLPL